MDYPEDRDWKRYCFVRAIRDMDSSRFFGLILNKINIQNGGSYQRMEEWSEEVDWDKIFKVVEQNCESEDDLVKEYGEDDEVLELSGT